MRIDVPDKAQADFFARPPTAWAFDADPGCVPGQIILFRFNGVAVARAAVSEVDAGCVVRCTDGTRVPGAWVVRWRPLTFIDLRNAPAVSRKGGATAAGDAGAGLFGA